MPTTALPVVHHAGHRYFMDTRLEQLRNVDNPHDFIHLDDTGDIRREVQITTNQLDGIFAVAEKQDDYVLALYKLVYPDYDNMMTVPRVIASKKLRLEIFRRAIEWDEKHVSTMKGGAWLNYGFSGDDDLRDIDKDTFVCTAE